MLSAIHTAIQTLLYQRGRIDPAEVDVRCERPSKQWIDSLTRPTIDLFLFDIAENTDLRQANMRTSQSNGRATQRLPPRRFDLRYLVCALSSVDEDEHLLLWRALATLLRYNPLPPDLLSEQLRALDLPLATRVGQFDDGPRALDLWGALDLPPRPALLFSVTAPLDMEIAFEAPLVLTRTTRFTRAAPGDAAAGAGIRADRAAAVDTGIQIGGVARDRSGAPLAGVALAVTGSAAAEVITGADGRWTLSARQPGEIALRVARPGGPPRQITITIPSSSYDIELD